MSDLLLLQSMGSAPDAYESVVDMCAPINRKYAANCGADFELFVGRRDEKMHPSWNRVARILDAFRSGYRKVCWLDTDTLVVNLSDSIFRGTDSTPFHSVRFHSSKTDGWTENDGVLVVNNHPDAVKALEWIWSVRHQPKNGHQQGWYDPYVKQNPHLHRPLDPRFNWFDWEGSLRDVADFDYPTRAQASIVAWHAFVGPRMDAMRAEFDRVYPHATTIGRRR